MPAACKEYAMATPKKIADPKPEGVKQPQDHAAKAEAKGEDVRFEYHDLTYVLERETLDDVELIEMLGDLAQNSLLLPKIVRTMLGPDQWAKFKDSSRNEAGRVPTERLSEMFTAMDDASGKSVTSPTS